MDPNNYILCPVMSALLFTFVFTFQSLGLKITKITNYLWQTGSTNRILQQDVIDKF